MFVKWKAMTSIKWVNCLLMTILVIFLVYAPIARGLSTVDERGPRKLFGGYRITPKFCRASKTLPPSDPRSKGPTICMFNHECAQRNGEVVGACMDGFLFGACCQIPGEIGNSLIQQAQTLQISPNSAAALSYESYGIQQSTNELKDETFLPSGGSYVIPELSDSQSSTGSFYESTGNELEHEASQGGYVHNLNAVPSDHNNNQFYVNQDSVVISSPSSLHFESVSSTPSSIETADLSGSYSQSDFTAELPAQITTQDFPSSYEENIHISKPTQSMNVHKTPSVFEDADGEFSHSDITHPGAESELIEDDVQISTGYSPSTVYVPSPTQKTGISTVSVATSSQSQRIPSKKPAFRPKPTIQNHQTQAYDEKYVLVQTITKDKTQFKPPIEGITSSDIESIESIILMLNDSNHGPSYNVGHTSPEPNRIVYSSGSTKRPALSTNSISSDKYASSGFYITTIPSTSAGVNTNKPPATKQPIVSPTQQSSYAQSSVGSYQPTYAASTIRPSVLVFSSTNRPSTLLVSSSTTKRPELSRRPPKPIKPVQNNEIIITPTRRPPTSRPTKTPQPPLYSYVVIPTKPVPSFIIKKPSQAQLTAGTKTPKPPSTSYVTGPTTPRPRPTVAASYASSTTSATNFNKIQQENYSSSTSVPAPSSYGSSQEYVSSTQKVPEYIKIPATQRPPSPTVVITPKPTVNSVTSSPWTKIPAAPTPSIASGGIKVSSVFSTSLVASSSERPDPVDITQPYPGLPTVISNDFDDPGYFDDDTSGNTKPPIYNQVSTNTLFTPQPLDDGPSYPGYYGPTPSYATFDVPTASEKDPVEEEETYTSPNDFVNFPPVRNPNLNMSATSSAVTYDFDLSTPAFVEDDVLKDKMNILVHKIVQSLQGNFNVLADIIEERNNSISQLDADRTTLRTPTTRRPVTTPTKNPQPTRTPTRRPSNRPSLGPNQGTTQRPGVTRKPTQVTKKPLSTKKPAIKPSSGRPTTRRPTKPTKRIPTTTEVPDDEEVQENAVETNEVETAGGPAEGSRRFQCGVRPHVKSGRIVGGKGAIFGEWPWQVLVRESTWLGLFTKNKCGGVLITNRYVVTAAHCQPGFLASLVAVFGEFDISGDLEIKRAVTKNVKRVIVHRQYDAATFENDLALLELESPIHYDTHIVPICMPSDNADFTGRMATVTGWGRLKYGGGVPSVLQEVQVPIIENSVCQEMFHTAGHSKKILQSFLCAGYANGQKDSCEGDSGGPLVLQRDDGRWELAGTVSHGIKCAAPYLPGVYMRTTYYKPWLKSITGIK